MLKSETFKKNKETLRVSCLVANLALNDKLLAVNLKAIALLETAFVEHTHLQFEGSG